MAPLVKELAKYPDVESICCLTGQHREMLDSVMDIFQLKGDYDLNIMEKRQTLSTITTKTLLGMEKVMEECRKKGFRVEHGEFGADMQVFSQNDGPVTIWFDTDQM